MSIAIGDIHGCLDPLQALIAQLPPQEELVFLGDYVDRGPDSAGVLRYLEALSETRPCVFLMGNHEDMMAKATETTAYIPNWLINGGEATLESYGVDAAEWATSKPEQRRIPAFERFHARLRPYHEDQDAIYVHAGIDPSVPHMQAQDPKVLLWVREPFHTKALDWPGKPIVFGHTPTQNLGLPMGAPYRKGPLRGIDTACVYGGRLTALDVSSGQLWQAEGGFIKQGRTA